MVDMTEGWAVREMGNQCVDKIAQPEIHQNVPDDLDARQNTCADQAPYENRTTSLW